MELKKKTEETYTNTNAHATNGNKNELKWMGAEERKTEKTEKKNIYMDNFVRNITLK